MKYLAVVLASVLILCGCGDEQTPAPSTEGALDGGDVQRDDVGGAGADAGSEPQADAPDTVLDDTDPAEYPPAPYGNAEGAVLADLTYVDADDNQWTFGDAHRAGDHKVMVFVTGAMWCSACLYIHQEMNTIASLYGDALVVLALFEDEQFGVPTAAHADRWQSRYELNYPVLADTTRTTENIFPALGTSNVVVVDLTTMTILFKLDYWHREDIEEAIRVAISE